MGLYTGSSSIATTRPDRRLGARVLAFVFIATLVRAVAIEAGPVELAWDPSPSAVTGYDVLWGTSSGTYTTTIQIGDVTTHTVEVPDGFVYYFVVRARSAGGTSTVSNEVSAWVSGSCSYSLSASSAASGASGGSGTVSVAAQSGCTWTATSSAPWLSVSTGNSGSGDGVVGYTVAPNLSSSPRTASLTIAHQTFTVTQSGGSGCTYTVSPTSAAHPSTASNGTIAVTSQAGCAWTASSLNPTWLTITAGQSGTGSGSVGYTVAANSGGPRAGALSVAGQTVSITQGSTFSANPTSLQFGAINANGNLVAKTSAQPVTVTQTLDPNQTWTATPNQPWIQVSPASGSGSATFNVSVVNPGSLPASGTLTGAVIVRPNGMPGPSVAVSLTLYAPGHTTRPVGALDAPTGLSTVSGSIVVGGWVVDDVEVSRVEVFRDRLPGEPLQGVFPANHPGYAKIYVATAEIVRTLPFGADTALFIDGARSDIEPLFPTAPWRHRAGWGYLMMTRGLPNGGTGTYRIHAYAFDRDGNYPSDYTLLGSRTFTADNRMTTLAAQKPFGAIDSPFPGETVSGVKLSGGWALTQPSDCRVVNVWVGVDSAPLQPAAYGDTIPGFDTYFPTASYADSPDVGVSYFLDSSSLANGLHQIGYLVQDSCGHEDGIGSRFFTVLNGSSVVTNLEAAVTAEPAAAAVAATASTPEPSAQTLAVAAGADEQQTPPQAAAASDDVPSLSRGYAEVSWAPSHGPERVPVGAGGARIVTVEPLERIALRLGKPAGRTDGSWSGYQVVEGQLRKLPTGSSLDTRDGVFYWQPGPGFMGSYELVFVRHDASGSTVEAPVRIEVRDQAPPPAFEPAAPEPMTPPAAPAPATPEPAMTAPATPPTVPEPPAPEPVAPAPVTPDPTLPRHVADETPAVVTPEPPPTAVAPKDAPGSGLEARKADESVAAPERVRPDRPAPQPTAALARGVSLAEGGRDETRRLKVNAGPDRTVEATGGWGTVTLRASTSEATEEATYRWSGAFGTVEGREVEVALPLGTHTIELTAEAGERTSDDSLVVVVGDSTPPRIEPRVTPAPDANGGLSGPATVSWVVTDPESSVLRLEGCESARVTASTTVRCTATNGAGQTATGQTTLTVRTPRR